MHRATLLGLCTFALALLFLAAPRLSAQTSAAAPAQMAPPGASAASTLPSGLTFKPFVALTTRYDSNLFVATTNAESDHIINLTPGMLLSYRSRRTDFLLFYRLTAAKYADHYHLNSWVEEQQGTIGWHHRTARRLRLGIVASYFVTHNPGRLTPQSGLLVGRNRATRTTVRPELAYVLSPRSALRFFYERSWQQIDSGNSIDTGTASVTFAHRLDRHDSLAFQLQNISYWFENGSSPTSTLLTAAWTHHFTPRTSLTLGAGPRNTNGEIAAEALASIRYRSRETELFLTYRKSQNVVIGRTHLLDTQSVSATLAYTPVRYFTIGFTPSWYETSGPSADTRGWTADFYSWFRFSPAWALGLTYSYQHQQGTPSRGAPTTLQRSTVSLTLRWHLPGKGRPARISPQPMGGVR